MERGLLQETKCVLKSLIVSCPHGMTIDELNRDYRRMVGQGIPFAQLGYPRLEAFLKSLTDTLQVHGSGPAARVSAVSVEKLEHIDKLVSAQKNATRDRRNATQARLSKPTVQVQALMPSPPVSISRAPVYYNENYRNYQQNNYQRQPPCPPPINPILMALKSNPPQFMYYNPPPFQFNPGLLPTPITINNNVNTLNRNRILHTPSPMQIYPPNLSNENGRQNHLVHLENKISETFEKNYAQKDQVINCQTHQNNSEQKLKVIEQCPADTAEINQLKEDQKSRKMEEKLENAEKPGEEPNKIKFKIMTPNLSNQTDKNFTQSSQNLSRSESRKSSLLSQSSNSENGSLFNSGKFKKSFIEIKSENKKGRVKDNEIKKSVIKKKSCDSEAVPELAHNDIVFLLDYPVGSVKFGEKILPSEIPSNIVEETWFGIFVTEVHNPYKFWFHLYKENHELDSLMQDIENYYEKIPCNEYQICHSNIKPGQVCAALFLGMWHRAEILEFPSNQQVKVFFVDYGTVADINLNNIKYLLHEFSTLRSQALRGCLAFIKPSSHRWSRDATYAFLDMVSDLLLYAKATEVNYKDRIVHMIITDTNEERDFQINDALIRKGHARFCQDAYVKGKQNQIISPKFRHFQEKYPTFDMLEQGEYPSFAEIGVLLAKGIDFEARQDENILPDIDENYSIEDLTKELTAFNISPAVNGAEDDGESETISLMEDSIKSYESKSDDTLKFGSNDDRILNPFLQKTPKNPFLSDDSCSNSVCSSKHSSTETIVSRKDEYAQCDLQQSQFEIPNEQHPVNITDFNLCMPNNHMQYLHPQFYNIITLPSLNYPTDWPYMYNSGPSHTASNTMITPRPPPGFEHVVPNGGNNFLP